MGRAQPDLEPEFDAGASSSVSDASRRANSDSSPTIVPIRPGDGGGEPKEASTPEGAVSPPREIGPDDLRLINTRKGLVELLRQKRLRIGRALETLHYQEEIEKLQIELGKLQRWVVAKKERVAILFEGRDAAGKGGAIRRFTEHLNPRSMRLVRCPPQQTKSAVNGTSNGTPANSRTPARSSSSTGAGTTARWWSRLMGSAARISISDSFSR